MAKLKVKSFLSWSGGKFRLLAEILPIVPASFRRYYEPFLGGGAVALEIGDRAQEMILSDKNSCLINAWEAVRDEPDRITDLLYRHKHQHDRGSEHFYSQKKLYNLNRGTGLEAAARFIYLNKSCFNGVWRCNKDGQLTITIGDHFTVPNVKAASTVVAGAAINHCEFDNISTAGDGDLIYLDPPYYSPDRLVESGYGIGKFTEHDRARMVTLAVQAGRRGATIIGSDLGTPYTRALYTRAGFIIDSFDYTYCVGGKANRRFISSELIYHNIL